MHVVAVLFSSIPSMTLYAALPAVSQGHVHVMSRQKGVSDQAEQEEERNEDIMHLFEHCLSEMVPHERENVSGGMGLKHEGHRGERKGCSSFGAKQIYYVV